MGVELGKAQSNSQILPSMDGRHQVVLACLTLKEVALIHTCWLKPFADFFSARDISVDRYCKQSGIETAHVTSGEGWVTKHQLYVFLELLSKGEKMPEMGFVVGEHITPDCLGALGEAMAQQETLGGVIRTFGQLINRHVEGNHCWLKEGDEGEVWFFNTKSFSPEPGRTLADHAGLMSMINLARLVAGRDWHPEKACLQTAPTRAHRNIPGLRTCQLHFNQEASGFAFPTEWLLRPTRKVVQNDADPKQTRGLIEEGESIPTKYELLLSEILGVGGILPSASLLADLIGLSPRTLHRSLKEHGTSYQMILDKVRLKKAKVLLEKSDSSIREIAEQLGFSGANNFIRTFKRLSGSTPGAYRRKTKNT